MQVKGGKEKAIQDRGLAGGCAETDGAEYVSIIIPCREEREYITRALRAVLANDWPADSLEVLVVDGMSADGTRDIVKAIATRDARVTLVNNPDLFAGSAMRVGAAAARGEYVVRVDAHAEIPPHYVKTGVAILRRHPEIWAVGGPVDRVAGAGGSRLVAAITSNVFSTGNTPLRVGSREGPVDAVANPVWRREVLTRLGDFDDALARNEDDDYFYRARRAGGIIYQEQKMRARYYVRRTVRELFRQYNQYAFWRVVVGRKHGRLLDWKPFVPPAFFAALALALVGGLITPYIWLGAGALALIYLWADLIASADIALKTGFKNYFKAFAIFPALHFVYAAGIISGIWYSFVRGFSAREIKRLGKFSGLTR